MNGARAAAPLDAPVRNTERIEALDILRGFALFGILLANVMVFSGVVWQGRLPGLEPSGLDWSVYYLLEVLLHGKFYSIFSILFGIGFYVFYSRAEQRGPGASRLFARRLTILLAIGLVHALLLWAGDILVLYALLGFVLLLFTRCQNRTLLYWIVGLLVLKVAIHALMWASGMQHPLAGRGPPADGGASIFERIIQGYQGGYPGILEANGYQVYGRWVMLFVTLRPLSVLAMFLIGMWIGRVGLAARLGEHRHWLDRTALIGLGLGLPLNILWAILANDAHPDLPGSPMQMIEVVLGAFAVPLLALGYMAAIARLMLTVRGPGWLRGFAPVGRMALTNYLLQTVCCIAIFYGAGLGFYGTVGHGMAVLLVIPVFIGQALLSAWWLSQFQYGPMEWLWRSLTYGKRMRIRKPVV